MGALDDLLSGSQSNTASPQQSGGSALDALSVSSTPTLPPRTTPGGNNPLITGTDPRLTGLPLQKTSGNFMRALGSAFGQAVHYGVGSGSLPAQTLSPIIHPSATEQELEHQYQEEGGKDNPAVLGTEAFSRVMEPIVENLGTQVGTAIGTGGKVLPNSQDAFMAGATAAPAIAAPFLPGEAAEGIKEPETQTPKVETSQPEPPKLESSQPKNNTPSPTINKSVRSDMTPDYDPSMEGKKIMGANGKIQQAVNPRDALGSTKTMNQSAADSAAEAEVQKLADEGQYPTGKSTSGPKSFTGKYQAVDNAIANIAEPMRNSLRAEDEATPLTDAQKQQVIDGAKQRLQQSPLMQQGLSERTGNPLPTNTSNTLLDNYRADAMNLLNNWDGTRESLLDLRQDTDPLRAKYTREAWGSGNGSKLSEMHANLRNFYNQELGELSSDTNVQDSLRQQSNLYHAKDMLVDKARNEPDTYFKAHPNQAMLKRQLIRGAGFAIPGAAIYAGRSQLESGIKNVLGKVTGGRFGTKPKAPKSNLPKKV